MNNAAQQYRQKTDTSTMTILKSEDKIYPMLYLYHAGMREACARFDMINEEFKFRYQRTPIHNVESRIKKPESIHEKLKRKNLSFTIESIKQNIHDIAGIRIVCFYIDDIYTLYDLVSKQDDLEIIRVRDYIKTPKENGYRSLHLIVQIPIVILDRKEWIPVEIQLRTIAMDLWANLEYDLKYKPGCKTENIDISNELLDCSNIIAVVDKRIQAMSELLKPIK